MPGGLFGIQVLDKRGRALDIRKQHGDVFAFAFEGMAGAQDSFGEMGRRIGKRGAAFLASRRRRFAVRWRSSIAERADGREQSLSVAERADTQRLEIVVRQLPQQVGIDFVLDE